MNTVQETITVSKKLFSRFKSINKAIQHAKKGSKIIVEPGIYSEKMIINKEIEIIGDQSKGEVIIESDRTMIIMDTDEYAIIKGLTIRQPLTAREFAIDIPKGKLVLEDCMIEAGISDCIYIANEADPLIRNCRIYNGKGKGIVFNNYAKGTIDSCELFGFNSAAMWVTSGSSPIIKNCKFYDGKGIGIAFDHNGQGTLSNCEIFQFEEYPSIWINDNSNPSINGCNIYNGKGTGIELKNNSKAIIENCHISNFRKTALLIDDHSKAEVNNCNIDDEIVNLSMEPKKSNKLVAIDLGSSNTRVAYIENDELKMMPFNNMFSIPSYLSFMNNSWVIGEEARASAEVNKNAFSGLNQYIGTNRKFTIDNTDYSADELLGIYLTCLKGLIDDYFNENIEEYVITTSNLNNYIFFNSLKNAIINHTDLKVVRLIGQTKAQGLYYGKGKENDETILLINMGAASTEITIMNTGDGAFWVLTTNNFSIGGNQFDIIIVNYLLKKFSAVYNYDLTKDPLAMQRIKNAAQQAKHDLTHNSITRIFIPYIFFEGADYKNLDIELTRNEFEQLSGEIVNQLKTKIQNELKSVGSTLPDGYQIEKIIIAGGSTRVPLIRQLFENELFPSKKPLVVLPDHSPVLGAAIQAGVITGDVRDIVLLDILGFSIYIETSKGTYIELVDKDWSMPTSSNTVFTTTYDHQTQLDFHLVYDDGEKDSLKKTICFFQIQGLPPAPKGDARLDVEIDIDKNRLIGVTVKDSNRDVVLQHILLGEPLQNIQSSVQNEIAVCKQVKEKFINNHGEICREIYRISDLAEIEKIQKGLMKVEQLLNQNETSDAVLNLRVISETFTRQIAIHNELTLENMDQHSRVNYLYEQSYLNSELYKLLNIFRKLGNKAAHEIVNNEYFDKNELLKLHDQLSSYVKDWVLKVNHS